TTKGGSDKVVTQTPTDQEQAVVETMEGKYRVVLDYLGLRIFTDPLDTADEALGLVNAFAHNEEGTAPKVSSIQKYNTYEGSWESIVFYRRTTPKTTSGLDRDASS